MSGEHISLETEIPVEGEHISPTVYSVEHIDIRRAWPGIVCGETHNRGTHIRATPVCRNRFSTLAVTSRAICIIKIFYVHWA